MLNTGKCFSTTFSLLMEEQPSSVAVRPDPPVNLNWMLLNVSLTSSYFDAMLNWVPPHSADVKMGWLTLQYQVQYRDNSTDKWTVVGISSLFQGFMNSTLWSSVTITGSLRHRL